MISLNKAFQEKLVSPVLLNLWLDTEKGRLVKREVPIIIVFTSMALLSGLGVYAGITQSFRIAELPLFLFCVVVFALSMSAAIYLLFFPFASFVYACDKLGKHLIYEPGLYSKETLIARANDKLLALCYVVIALERRERRDTPEWSEARQNVLNAHKAGREFGLVKAAAAYYKQAEAMTTDTPEVPEHQKESEEEVPAGCGHEAHQ